MVDLGEKGGRSTLMKVEAGVVAVAVVMNRFNLCDV